MTYPLAPHYPSVLKELEAGKPRHIRRAFKRFAYFLGVAESSFLIACAPASLRSQTPPPHLPAQAPPSSTAPSNVSAPEHITHQVSPSENLVPEPQPVGSNIQIASAAFPNPPGPTSSTPSSHEPTVNNPGENTLTEGEEDAEDDPAQPGSLPEVNFEEPYSPIARPRASGRILAAGQDEDLARWNLGGNSDPNYISNRPGFHPGARVVVDLELKRGKLPARAVDRITGRTNRSQPSVYSLLAHARKWGYWNFRICFEQALYKNPSDHGETKLSVDLSPNGQVLKSRLLQTKLKDAEAAKCLETETKNYRAFSPAPKQSISLELSIKLWPGDAPLPAQTPAPDELAQSFLEKNPGKLKPAAFLKAIEPMSPRVRRCYAQGLARDARLWGRIQYEVQIPDTGGAPKLRQSESNFPDRKTVRCIQKVLQKVEFPAPEAGQTTLMFGLRLGDPNQPSAPELAADTTQ